MLNYNRVADKIPTSELVSVYNSFADTPVKKFTDRATAMKRAAKLLEEKVISLDEIKKLVCDDTKKDLEKIKTNKGGQGKKSQYAGKKIYKKVKDNPRREGTHGHRSWELIKNGMTYEEYISAGGRNNDFTWDLARDRIEVK